MNPNLTLPGSSFVSNVKRSPLQNIDWAIDFTKPKPLSRSNNIEFGRNTAASVIDYRGVNVTTKANELRIHGANRIENLTPYSNDWTKNIIFNAADESSYDKNSTTLNDAPFGSSIRSSLHDSEAGKTYIISMSISCPTGTTVVAMKAVAHVNTFYKLVTVEKETGRFYLRFTALGSSPIIYGLEASQVNSPGSEDSFGKAFIIKDVMLEEAKPGQLKPSSFTSSGELITDGKELISNPNFSDGLTDWVSLSDNGTTHKIVQLPTGIKYYCESSTPALGIYQNFDMVVGDTYKLTVIVDNINQSIRVQNGIVNTTLTDTVNEIVFIALAPQLAFYRSGAGVTEVNILSVSVQRLAYNGFGVDSVKYINSRPPENMLVSETGYLPGFNTSSATLDKVSTLDDEGWCTVTKQTSTTSESIGTSSLTHSGGAGMYAEFLATDTNDAVSFGIRQLSPALWPADYSAQIVSGPGKLSGSSSLLSIDGLSKTVPTVLKCRAAIVDGSAFALYIYPAKHNSGTIGAASKVRKVMLTPFNRMPISYDSGLEDEIGLPSVETDSENVAGDPYFTEGLTFWDAVLTDSTHTVTPEEGGIRFEFGSTSATTRLQRTLIHRVGSRYRAVVDLDVTSGSVKTSTVDVDGVAVEIYLNDGVNEIYYTAKSSTFMIYRASSNVNILVKSIHVYPVADNVVDGAILEKASANHFLHSEGIFGNGQATLNTASSTDSHLQIFGFDNTYRFSQSLDRQYLYSLCADLYGKVCVSCFVQKQRVRELAISGTFDILLKFKIGQNEVPAMGYTKVSDNLWRVWAFANIDSNSYNSYGVFREGAASFSDEFLFSGLQVELGETPTSYLKTESSIVSRSADALTWEKPDSEYSMYEGTFTVNAKALSNDTDSPYAQSIIRMKGAKELLVSNHTGSLEFDLVSDLGAEIVMNDSLAWKANDVINIAVQYDQDGVSINRDNVVQSQSHAVVSIPVDSIEYCSGGAFSVRQITYNANKLNDEVVTKFISDKDSLKNFINRNISGIE